MKPRSVPRRMRITTVLSVIGGLIGFTVGCGSSSSEPHEDSSTTPAGGHGGGTSGATQRPGDVVTGGAGGTRLTATTVQGGASDSGGHSGAGAGVTDLAGGGPSSGGAGSGTSNSSTSGGVSVGGASSTGGASPTGGTSSIGSGGSAGAAATGGRGGAGPGTGGATTMPTGPVEMADAAHVHLLAGSPFYDRQQLHRQGHLAEMNVDKLLFPYRSLAKLPQAGAVTSGYAGWDTGFIAGHMTGHYLSAVSRMAAATGDEAFSTKANYVVAELAKCQTALARNGYLAAFPDTVFDWVEGKAASNGGIVVPYYTVHKIMAGLLDAYHYVGNRQALEVVTKMADYFRGRLAGLSAAAIEKMFRTDGSGNPQNEFGAMSDVLTELSTVTGKTEYLDMAKLFNRSWFMAPLAAGQDKLSGLHANTHIAQALGIARTANVSRDPESLAASEKFWELLTDSHAFVTGGDSFREWLGKPDVEAGPSVDGGAALPPTTGETCNTHNMLKLTQVLFQRQPRIDYADYHERALYNHILASVAPDTGQMTYFTPMYGNFRTYLNGTYCCSGSGIENTPRYNEGIYFVQGASVWVNLYVPSELTWDAAKLTLEQKGNAAAGETVQIAITKAEGASQATVNLRIPYWVTGAPVVQVNGVQEQSVSTAAYYSISRPWKVGDTITVKLPTSLRLEHAKDKPELVSVFFGPILLAGELGRANMPNDFADKDAYLSTANIAVPTIANASKNPTDWLAPMSASPLTYTVQNAGSANGIMFRPLYEVHHQRYSVYWPQQ